MDSRNLNLDPVIKIGLDYFYCEDNQILILTTIHGSKLELKQLRYWENHEKYVSTLPEVTTFDPSIGILIYLAF